MSTNDNGDHGHLLKLFRITVLGGPRSGKTSLVAAFINNFYPTVYVPTDDPGLYYKTLDLSEDHHHHYPVLAEVEDTYAADREDGEDCYGNKRGLLGLLTASPTTPAVPADAPAPLECFRAPKIGSYAPMTRTRMGIIIVFDANSASSLNDAIQAHTLLETALQESPPVVCFVASQVDKDPAGADFHRIRHAGWQYAEEKGLLFKEVSAPDLKRVKRVFRAVLLKIKERPELWSDDNLRALPPPEPAPVEKETGLGALVGLQAFQGMGGLGKAEKDCSLQ